MQQETEDGPERIVALRLPNKTGRAADAAMIRQRSHMRSTCARRDVFQVHTDEVAEKVRCRYRRIDGCPVARCFAKNGQVLHHEICRRIRKVLQKSCDRLDDPLDGQLEFARNQTEKEIALRRLRETSEEPNEHHSNGVGGTRNDVFLEQASAEAV